MGEVKQYLRVTLYIGEQSQGSFVETPEALDTAAVFGEMLADEWFKVEPVEMTESEYRALPEFDGF